MSAQKQHQGNPEHQQLHYPIEESHYNSIAEVLHYAQDYLRTML
jgi:hypothetical protein